MNWWQRFKAWFAAPDLGLLEHNAATARTHLSYPSMVDRLRALLLRQGWLP